MKTDSLLFMGFVLFAAVLLSQQSLAQTCEDGPSWARGAGSTCSLADSDKLPVENVFDPLQHENNDITDYSYEELASFFDSSLFLRMNDEGRVCESMYLMFGRAPPACGAAGARVVVPYYPRSSTARAYVDFRITPYDERTIVAPVVNIEPGARVAAPPVRVWQSPVIIVDPVYPPWSPTYNPYW